MNYTVADVKNVLEKDLSLSANSKKIYFRNFKKICSEFGCNDLSFLKRHDEVMKKLEEKGATSSIKQKYISLVSILKRIKAPYSLYEPYERKMLSFRDKNNRQIKENKASKKEESNFIRYEKLREISETLGEELKGVFDKPYSKMGKRTQNKALSMLSDQVILYFYSRTPPTRLEGYNVYFTEKVENNEENFFFVDLRKKRVTYHLNDFKNVKKIGKVKVVFPKELSLFLIRLYDFLKKYNLSYGGRYIPFFKSGGGKVKGFNTTNAFGLNIKRVFEKYTGKKITINDLRHIYTTAIMSKGNYNRMSILQKEKLHQQLLHNKETGEQYFKLYESLAHDQFVNDEVSITDIPKLKKLLASINVKLVIPEGYGKN